MKEKKEKKRKKKNGSKFNKFSKIWAISYLLSLLVFELALVYIDILPRKMLFAAMLIAALLSVILFMQLFFSNVKKKAKIFAFVLSSLLMVLYIGGSTYALGTDSFLNKISTKKALTSSITKHSFNIYISGMDTRGVVRKPGRSDVNMIATINPKTHKVLLTSIPRDYQIELTGKDNASDKLTHTGMYGIDQSIASVEKLTGLKMDYYVKVNFSTVEKLVDAIGGIDVNSEYAFHTIGYDYKTYKDTTYDFEKGENHLDGSAALAFARERYSFSDGDNQRVKDEQIVMQAMLNKILSSRTLLLKYNTILNAITDNINMSLTPADIKALVKLQLNDAPEWKFETQDITGYDSYQATYSSGSQRVYVMSPNQESIDAAVEKINKIIGKKTEDDNTQSDSES